MVPRTRDTDPVAAGRVRPSGRRVRAEPRPSALNRYLLDSEHLVFAVRRHSAVLAGSTSIYLLVLFVAFLLLGFADGSSAIATTGLVVLLAASAWFAWKVGDWWVERFTVTDRRVLLVSGLLTRRVAIMPLRKVTDLTFERSFVGRLFGYGAFVMESAGQQQALSRIDFLPRPESLYLQMSDLLFGSGEGDYDPDEDGSDRRRRSRRPRAPRDTLPAAPDRSTDAVLPTERVPTERVPTERVQGQPTVRVRSTGPGTSTTAPLPAIARSGPVARRPRGRQGEPGRGPDGMA